MKFIDLLAISLSLTIATVPPGSFHTGSVGGEAKLNYDGYHVFSITATDKHEAGEIEERFATYHSVQVRNTLQVAIPPHQVRSFKELGLDAHLLSDDLGKQIREADRPSNYRHALHRRGELPDLAWFDSYHDYQDHLQYWDDLVAALPNNSQKVDLGPSYEGRRIHAFNFWGDKGEKGSKPVILWHATVHAREWISTLVIEYLAYQLIAGYISGDQNVTNYLNTYDFWLVPFHNPDGFVYTQTTDRLWRKNRQPRSNTTCIGTDGNRNWKYKWGSQPGASPDPCSGTFQGGAPGDTPENLALSSLSDKLAASPRGIRSFIDWHSYGNKILTPYGWTCDPAQYPESLPRMLQVANGTAAAINASSGAVYQYGTGCDIEYYSAGNSRDHHYGIYSANHSWTLELEPATAGEGGFILPPERIWSVVKEQWNGQLWLLNDIREN